MDSLHLLELRRFGSVGCEDAVAAEVSLVGAGEVVACVEPINALLQFAGLIDGLVHPVPNGSANGGIALLDDVPRFAQVANGISHGVGIFTYKERFVEIAGVFLEPLDARIHLAVEVAEAMATHIGAVARAFVVDGTRGVEHFCATITSFEIATAAGLVAQAPEDDAGVVAVAHDHALYAVDEGGFPAGHVGNGLVGMVFKIGLVHGIEPVVVEHGIHTALIGIVAGANGVDVVLLHEHHVAQHFVDGDGTSVKRRRVVAVHTLKEYLFAVDEHLSALKFDVAESILGGEGHFLIAVGIALHHANGIEIGRLGTP